MTDRPTPPDTGARAGGAACAQRAAGSCAACQWRLQRRCALRPGQLLLAYGALAAFSTAVALPFGWQGLWAIPLWCLLEVAVAGALFLFYMLHAADGERIGFGEDGCLAVEVVRGLDTRQYRLNPAWAHLERGGLRQERLWLCCSPVRIEVASQLAPRERRRVERELKQALALRRAGLDGVPAAGALL